LLELAKKDRLLLVLTALKPKSNLMEAIIKTLLRKMGGDDIASSVNMTSVTNVFFVHGTVGEPVRSYRVKVQGNLNDLFLAVPIKRSPKAHGGNQRRRGKPGTRVLAHWNRCIRSEYGIGH